MAPPLSRFLRLRADSGPSNSGVMITVAASMGFCLFGCVKRCPKLEWLWIRSDQFPSESYDQGVMSGLISAPQFFRVFPACDPAEQGSYKGT